MDWPGPFTRKKGALKICRTKKGPLTFIDAIAVAIGRAAALRADRLEHSKWSVFDALRLP
jgi:hypothetical protein